METNIPKIFIIILNYNGKETIKKCLDSVFYSDYSNFEVVVVDNDSKDGSFELAKSLYSKFHFIKNTKNSGFSAGNNVGIRFALEKMADYVFLLNNDAVLEKNTLSKLVEASEKETAGIFSPLIYNREITSGSREEK
jgi:GT2 family glycosyltransferase